MCRMVRAEPFGHEQLDRLAHQLVALVMEEVFGLGVDHEDLALTVCDNDCVRSRFEQASKTGSFRGSIRGIGSIHKPRNLRG